ncbi:granulocyte colony-stimulating factor receptor-like [Microcaecilia unicolor]|uniref:Granulocyte colony-stimulating factor receptor-like n=1 Tax=Microcaecilia unicolor TaxID=1415580 RepID=A0A6P7ZI30_9AMPH|nr:granulocyte colony-stimulating factor receptor-like [Microcaecilia unicolor]
MGNKEPADGGPMPQENSQEREVLGFKGPITTPEVNLEKIWLKLRVDAFWDSCGILTSPQVVQLGMAMSASCKINSTCLLLNSSISSADVVWTLNGEQIPRDSNSKANPDFSMVTIPQVNSTRGNLSCYLLHKRIPYLLGSVAIHAGVPPDELQILHCFTVWTANLTCYWDPGQETHLPTIYTLHVREDIGTCDEAFNETKICVSAPDSSFCTLTIDRMMAHYSIWVTGENQLGRAISHAVCLHATEIVKLNPPEIEALTSAQGCLIVKWKPPVHGLNTEDKEEYEIRCKDQEGLQESWLQVPFTAAENESNPKQLCSVSPYTRYVVQMRAKYPSNFSHWSAWSQEKSVTTEPAAPSHSPALWRRIAAIGADRRREVLLMWKPLKKKEANGKILGYRLFSQMKGRKETAMTPECITEALQYVLVLSEEQYVIFLTAYNSAGESPSAKIIIPAASPAVTSNSLLSVLISPVDDHSLLLHWAAPLLPAASYVIEWFQEPGKLNWNASWHYEAGNINHIIIKDVFEPGRLYNLSVHALSDGDVWASGTTCSYSKQLHPLSSPVLYPTQIWKSQVALKWGDIPVRERRGIVRNYSLFYGEPGGEMQSVVLNSSIHHYTISNLSSGSLLQIHIMVSTDGGSSNSSVLTITTNVFDDEEMELLLSSLFIGLTLVLIFAVLTCIYKHQLIKAFLWPQVPDPANTNLGSWKPKRVWMQGTLFPTMEHTETLRMCLSWFPSRGNSELTSATHEDMKRYFVEKTWQSDTHEASTPSVMRSYDVSHSESGQQVPALYPNKVQYSAVLVHVYGLPQCHPAPQVSDSAILHHGSCGTHTSWLGQNPPLEGDLDGLYMPHLELPGGSPASVHEFPFLMALVVEDDSQPGQNHHPVSH